jgi:hypothetical protein
VNRDLTSLPINILQLKKGNFARTKAQTSKQQQDCMIAETHGSLKITAIQNLLYLIGLEILGDIGQRPTSHSGHTRCKIGSKITSKM